MSRHYNQKRAELAALTEELDFAECESLQVFKERLCAPPFPKHIGAAELWLSLWSLLNEKGKLLFVQLPNPCLNHVEARARKPDRARLLWIGLQRLLKHSQPMFLQGMRLYPHSVCRTAETIGPLIDEHWAGLEEKLQNHRLWSIKNTLTEDEFWETAEYLEDFRDLPQPVLDHLDLNRPREKAPINDFMDSLQKFLLRERIEKIRTITYKFLRGYKPVRPAIS